MPLPDQRSKVTLEDLLRLKRTELPSQEFWSRFEYDMRQKQLTALVKRRHWWHDLSRLLNRRVYLPVGASAIVALSLITVRYFSPTQIAPVTDAGMPVAAANSAIETLPATMVVVSIPVQSGSHIEPITVASSPSVVTNNTSDAVPNQSIGRQIETATARISIAHLVHLGQSELELADPVMGSRLSPAARPQPTDAKSELVSLTNASASKYRLIARYADRTLSPAPSAPAVVRERLARRLGDDLGDNVSRIGVVGDRVSLKF